MIKKQFIALLQQGLYYQAKKLITHLNKKDYEGFMMDCGLDDPTIVLYTFACFMLYENETADGHFFLARLLVHALSMLEGSYSAALLHIRRAIELDPHNKEYKQEMLFFYGTPDNVMSIAEAESIAQRLLIENSHDQAALETIQKIMWSKQRSNK